MGTCMSTTKINPEKIQIVNSIEDETIIHHRRTTDVVLFTFHAIALVILVLLLLYCVYNGNIYRIIYGYDSCGNICGQDNFISSRKNISCGGQNMKSKPFILIFKPEAKNVYLTSELRENDLIVSDFGNNTVQRVCLQNCSLLSNYHSLLNRCVIEKGKNLENTFLGRTGLKDFFQEVTEDFELCWLQILYMCLISLAFSVLIIILLRFLVGLVVWLVLIAVNLACILGTAHLCSLTLFERMRIIWKEAPSSNSSINESKSSYFAFAVLASIITICVCLVILVMRKQIQLVIQLFREAGKAISAMPLLLLQPTITFLCIGISIACWIYFSLWIESAGYGKETNNNSYVYEKDVWIHITRWYNIFIFLWMLQFFIGCQHMIIASAISSWYFTRNKSNLDKPIFHGLYNLLRYHLGSVSCGSLIISIVQFARILLSLLQKYCSTHTGRCANYLIKCCQCCLFCLEKILKYITRNAYIEIAIHGYSFCKAGKEAFKLLLSNAMRVTAINSVGDFVLLLSKVLVIMATVLIGIEIMKKKDGVIHIWVPLTLCGVFAYLISHCFLSVYEMTIDTIFICFCEDCNKNDGVSKPYFMSKELMQFVENSNVALSNVSKQEVRINQPTSISSEVE